jgi:hypothetical protein
MKFRVCVFALVFSSVCLHAQIAGVAQRQKPIDKLRYAPTIWTLSWVFVDNDGDPYTLSLQSLNRNPMPLSLKVDKDIYKKFSVSSVVCFSRFESLKEVNNVIMPYSTLYFSVDLNGKLSLKDKNFSLYILSGLGYTTFDFNRFNSPKFFNANIGTGFFIKLNRKFGVNIESAAKFGLKKPLIRNNLNHFLHTVGFSMFLR